MNQVVKSKRKTSQVKSGMTKMSPQSCSSEANALRSGFGCLVTFPRKERKTKISRVIQIISSESTFLPTQNSRGEDDDASRAMALHA